MALVHLNLQARNQSIKLPVCHLVPSSLKHCQRVAWWLAGQQVHGGNACLTNNNKLLKATVQRDWRSLWPPRYVSCRWLKSYSRLYRLLCCLLATRLQCDHTLTHKHIRLATKPSTEVTLLLRQSLCHVVIQPINQSISPSVTYSITSTVIQSVSPLA